MDKEAKILVVGHNGILENGLAAFLQNRGYRHVLSSSSSDWDVCRQEQVEKYFEDHRPDYVFLGSTRSGGIEANQKFAGEFIYHNLISTTNIIQAAYHSGVKKLLYIGSSCVYPKESPQPIKEEYLLTGPLEETSEPYSVAKIAGIKLCQAYRKQFGLNAVVMIPATLYGEDRGEDKKKAHVLGALISKFYQAVKDNAREVILWGTGSPRREFLFIEDFGAAAEFLMDHYDDPQIINAGCGQDISIKKLAEIIAKCAGFQGKIIFDESKPDGVQQKLLDHHRITELGWKPLTGLQEGIAKICQLYKHSRD